MSTAMTYTFASALQELYLFLYKGMISSAEMDTMVSLLVGESNYRNEQYKYKYSINGRKL